MKKVFIFLLMVPIIVKAQSKNNGYAYLQPSFFISQSFENKFHINGGIGLCPGAPIGLGAGFDFFVFKSNQSFFVPKIDIRGFIKGLDNPTAVYITMQPGYVVYNKSSSSIIKGGFAFDALFGIIAKPKNGNGGITMNAGYSMLTFKSYDISTRHNGFKIQAGFAF